jgi:hypothetical protein
MEPLFVGERQGLMNSKKDDKSPSSSFRQKPESSLFKAIQETWTPFFNGVTSLYEGFSDSHLRLTDH